MQTNLHPTIAASIAHWTPPTICRRCDAVIEAIAHTLTDCDREQIDQAMLADKKNGGYERRALATGLKDQKKLIDCGAMS